MMDISAWPALAVADHAVRLVSDGRVADLPVLGTPHRESLPRPCWSWRPCRSWCWPVSSGGGPRWHSGLSKRDTGYSLKIAATLSGLSIRTSSRFTSARRRSPGAELQGLHPFDARALRILLVDDNADNRRLIGAYLKHTQFLVAMACNGQEGVEKFRQGVYDLVLMDMHMPVLDGYRATMAIRDWEREKGRRATPILALTASASCADESKTFAAGCNGHVSKPVRKERLLAAISEYTGFECAPPAGTPPRRRVVKVDPDLADMVPGFLENRRQDLLDLSLALERHDFELIVAIGHTLKGSGGGYGFKEISLIGRDLEVAVRKREEGDIRTHLAALDTFLGQVEVQVEE